MFIRKPSGKLRITAFMAVVVVMLALVPPSARGIGAPEALAALPIPQTCTTCPPPPPPPTLEALQAEINGLQTQVARLTHQIGTMNAKLLEMNVKLLDMPTPAIPPYERDILEGYKDVPNGDMTTLAEIGQKAPGPLPHGDYLVMAHGFVFNDAHDAWWKCHLVARNEDGYQATIATIEVGTQGGSFPGPTSIEPFALAGIAQLPPPATPQDETGWVYVECGSGQPSSSVFSISLIAVKVSHIQ